MKTLPDYFSQVSLGNKTFEARINDRNYQVGDEVALEEYDPVNGYTGFCIEVRITYVLEGGQFGIHPDWCVFGFKILRDLHMTARPA